jgi:PAS domain-containing protein
LGEESARSRLILDSATDYPIIPLDIEGCITGWNAGAQRIMDYAEVEILGRSGDVIFRSEARAEGRLDRELCRPIEAGSASMSGGTCAGTAAASGPAAP